MTFAEYKQRLEAAFNKAAQRAEAIDRNGGSSEELK
jgi:hypothetical protein